VSTGKGKFPEKTSSKPCKWVMWSGDVQEGGVMKAKDAKMLPVGAFVEGELYLSWMHYFQALSFLLFLFVILSFIVFFLFFQELIKGHCPGVVTNGDSVTHKYFHRNEKVGL
jgi:hypothetical protein